MKDNLAVNAILKYFKITKGILTVGGKTFREIAQEVGTPFYVYDLNIAKRKFQMLRQALPPRIKIHYAIKANPHPDVIVCLNTVVDGFDVASGGELQKAIQAGVDPSFIGFAGPGKSVNEIEAACHAGIGSLNAESLDEIEKADMIAARLGKPLNVSLRVNPAYELAGSGMRMGGGAKQFGIDQENIPDILSGFRQWKNLSFKGFHIFAGSQNLKADLILQAFEKAVEALVSFLPYCPEKPSMVNLGGGFGIPYYASDSELDIGYVAAGLARILEKEQKTFENMEIIIETGRYLVGECGVYVSRINEIKRSRGETFLITNGGLHHHLAASGNFGQVIKRPFPVIFPEKLDTPPDRKAHIVGPLCTPLDTFGSSVPVPEPEVNDLVGILASGAYGYTASPLNFLSHPVPVEVIIQ